MSVKKSNKIFVAAALTAALSACEEEKESPKDTMEKCYGIAKAGQNDCASSSGASCSGSSTVDGDKNAWMMLPKGFCDRIVGGSTESNSFLENVDSDISELENKETSGDDTAKDDS